MTNENTTRACSNCKYFQRYYVIGCNNRFMPTSLGCCKNFKVTKAISTQRVKKDEGCELWQPYELQKLVFQYSIEEKLQDINKTLENILALLRDAE